MVKIQPTGKWTPFECLSPFVMITMVQIQSSLFLVQDTCSIAADNR